MGTYHRCKIYSACLNCGTIHGNHHPYTMRVCSSCYCVVDYRLWSDL